MPLLRTLIASLLPLALALPTRLHAQARPTAQDSLALAVQDTLRPHRAFTVLPIPVLGYSPETRFMTGLTVVSTVQVAPDVRPGNARLEFDITQNRQMILDAEYEGFTRGERLWVRGFATWRYFPENFWGIGNQTPASALEQYSNRRVEAEGIVLWQAVPRWRLFVGPRYFLQHLWRMEPQAGGQLEGGGIRGSQGGTSSGIGFQAALDHRDHTLNPHRGWWFQCGSQQYARFTGSDYTFGSYFLDYRRYFTVAPGPRHVLAFQVRGLFHTGSPPFRLMALMGNSSEMRGYYGGRYRDRNMLSCQVEYRFPMFRRWLLPPDHPARTNPQKLALWRRVGFVVFAGVGEVTRDFQDLALHHLKTSMGVGGRFLLDRRRNINLRMDVAFGIQGSRGLYLSFAEAF
jgi:hypothetical protein